MKLKKRSNFRISYLLLVPFFSVAAIAEKAVSEESKVNKEPTPHCIVYLENRLRIQGRAGIRVHFGHESDCKVAAGVCVAYFEPKETCNKENKGMIDQFVRQELKAE